MVAHDVLLAQNGVHAHLGLPVGGVGQHDVAVAVARGEHALHVGAALIVHDDARPVGLHADGLKAQGIDYEVKKLSMRYAGRFVAENEGADGLCKILVNKEHRNVIGVHMIGNYSSEIIWGAAEMIELELRVKDAKEIIFPHPTVSEIIRETLWEFDD